MGPSLRFPGRLPSHHLSLTSSSPLYLNLGTHGMMSPTKSSVVLVAGSALRELQNVMKSIDHLAKDMKMIPYVVILLLRDNDIVPDTDRHAMSPPVVSLQALHLNCNWKQPFCRCGSMWTSMAPSALDFSSPAVVA